MIGLKKEFKQKSVDVYCNEIARDLELYAPARKEEIKYGKRHKRKTNTKIPITLAAFLSDL